MTSIERTAYPRFGRVVTARELTALSPSPNEVAWARDLTRSDAHLLALVTSLKCFQRLGYFPRLSEVPDAVVGHLTLIYKGFTPLHVRSPGTQVRVKPDLNQSGTLLSDSLSLVFGCSLYSPQFLLLRPSPDKILYGNTKGAFEGCS